MMNEDETRQVTWDLLIAVRRLNGNEPAYKTDDPRHQFFNGLLADAVKRFGHD